MRKGNSSRNSGNARKSSRQEDKGSSRGRKSGPSSSRTRSRSSDKGDDASFSKGARRSSGFSKEKRGASGYSSERKSSSFSSKRGAPSSYKGRKRDDDSGSSDSRGGYSSERKSSSYSPKRGAPSSYKGRKRDDDSSSSDSRGGYSSEQKSSSYSSKRGAPSSYKGRKRDDDSGSSDSRGGYSSERKSSSYSSKRGAPSSYKGRKRDDDSGSSDSRGGYSSERKSSSYSSKRGAPSSYKGRKRDGDSDASEDTRGGYSSERRRGGSSSYGDRKRGSDSESSGKKRFGSDKPGKFSEKRPYKERTDEDRPKRRSESTSDQPVKRYVRRSRVAEPQQEPESTGTLQSGTEKIRLNKYIANSGVCSRREADELIGMGLITVNGVAVTELGYKVNPTDEVRYEGKLLRAEKPVYILMNKPKGYLTTTKDPQERNTVMHIIGSAVKERVYPVGRLDRNTTGLLLLTNDGDLADKLSHPSYNVKKIYRVELDRPLTRNDFERILEGIQLEEGKARVDDLAIVSDDGKTVGVELHIGWNRVVRRIFEALEYNVVKLDRSVYAGLDKKDLARGAWRFLRKDEIIHLKHFK